MKKILKRMKKGFKTACLSAALATCWSAGQVAQAEMVTVQISGTVSPTESNISHLYLFYGTGSSDFDMPVRIKLGDFPVDQSLTFQQEVTVEHNEWELNSAFCTIGLYGDISSGEYIEGINGVSLGLSYIDEEYLGSEQFDWHFWSRGSSSYTEEEVFDILLSDDLEEINNFGLSEMLIIWSEDLNVSGTLNLYNFSGASTNGQIDVHAAVPEPVSMVLFGTGAMIFVACRRREKQS